MSIQCQAHSMLNYEQQHRYKYIALSASVSSNNNASMLVAADFDTIHFRGNGDSVCVARGLHVALVSDVEQNPATAPSWPHWLITS
ncbi:hypothetical protein BAUCODRAFT_125838 [Baudoinia panamericana UAMH 10762]|uniref:Uncharacterized protein n=1 Tax=Baudoinia panamericana (strain UAMH 10762) TaxID=717646 RepID=M2LFS2_BAUPA|nr:uncharacterized protein BAUCODRAFT_125838 [Baudoinia panamericana UAMH 10762]EMC92882.1 hypothetical protein BAUCODRAFT_125838 [Baudoinia panamericana UAMH 10762]